MAEVSLEVFHHSIRHSRNVLDALGVIGFPKMTLELYCHVDINAKNLLKHSIADM